MLISGMLALAACSGGDASLIVDKDLNDSGDLIAPNVKYQESYKEKELTYSRVWPQGIVEGLSKSNPNTEILADYEHIKKTLGFDDEGNMFYSYEVVDGDLGLNMPEDLFNELKDKMPARSDEDKGIKSFVMKDGMMTYTDFNGQILNETPYDILEFQIDPEKYDSLQASQETTAEAKISRTIRNLEASGIDFKIHNAEFAFYSLESDDNHDFSIDKIIDLKTGNEIKSATKLPNGKYESITSMSYEEVEGFQVLKNSETLFLGEINGDWEVVKRRVTNRSDIKVIINNNEENK
tara:strand:- start:1815 stop:2696 length:882 start_codon:yes stop_codon:yes gene_type:complete